MQKRNLEENLTLCQSENEPGFALSDRDALNAAAINFREITGVVDDKRHGSGGKSTGISARPDAHAVEKVSGNVKDDDDLEHERRAADNPNQCAGQISNRRRRVHAAEGNNKPERQGADKRHKKKFERLKKSFV